MTLLAADIGNSHTFLGLLDGEEVTAHWRVNTDERRTADEWSVLLRGLLAERLDDVDGIVDRIDATVTGIHDITAHVDGATRIAAVIAGSVRQQSHAAAEIRRHTAVMASNGDDMQLRMTVVADSAEVVDAMAHHVSATSRHVSEQAGALRAVAGAFLAELRAAFRTGTGGRKLNDFRRH